MYKIHQQHTLHHVQKHTNYKYNNYKYKIHQQHAQKHTNNMYNIMDKALPTRVYVRNVPNHVQK